jgi:hypothetical protein
MISPSSPARSGHIFSDEYNRFHSAIELAFRENEPPIIYYALRDQVWDARGIGLITIPEWSALQSFLDQYWDGQSEPDAERQEDD